MSVAQQVQILSDELAVLKSEIISLKSSHATMHQGTVESNAQAATKFQEQAAKIMEVAEKVEKVVLYPTTVGQKSKSLIEPKNVTVEVFAGSIAESRSKFLEWGETVRDRAELFDSRLNEAMVRAETRTEPITEQASIEMGVGKKSCRDS